MKTAGIMFGLLGLAIGLFYMLFLVLSNFFANFTTPQVIYFFITSLIIIGLMFGIGLKVGSEWEKLHHPRIPVMKYVEPENQIMPKTTRNITVPAFIENGVANPIGFEDSITILGETIEVKWLYRLCECPTPSRSEWTGNRDKYTQATKIAIHFGAIVKEGQGFRWKMKPTEFHSYITKTLENK